MQGERQQARAMLHIASRELGGDRPPMSFIASGWALTRHNNKPPHYYHYFEHHLLRREMLVIRTLWWSDIITRIVGTLQLKFM